VKIFTLLAIIAPILEIYSIAEDLGLFKAVIENWLLTLSISIPVLITVIVFIMYYLKKLTKY
jgi:hypothetical protein